MNFLKLEMIAGGWSRRRNAELQYSWQVRHGTEWDFHWQFQVD